MMSLDELKKLAREAEYGKSDLRVHPATILELCALLVQAEEALDECDNEFTKRGIGFQNLDDALAAIKQWKETK